MVNKKSEGKNLEQIVETKTNYFDKNSQKNQEIIKELERNGKFFEAIELSEMAKLNILKTHGKTAPDYAFFLEKMAHLYQKICYYGRSERLLLELNDLNLNKKEEDPRAYANGLQKLASVYSKMGRYEDAEKLLKEAKELYLCLPNLKKLNLYSRDAWQKPDEEDKGDLAKYALILNNLGKVFQEQGENKNYLGETDNATKYYEDSIKSYEWAKRFLRHTNGDKHIDYGRNLKDLANLHGILGNYEYAESKMKKACHVYKKYYSKNDPANFNIQHKYAWLLYRQGKYCNAGTHLLNTKNRFKVTCGKHPAYATLLNNLAKTEMAETYYHTCKSKMNDEDSAALIHDAYDLMKDAFEINNEILPQLLYMDSDRQRLRFLRSLDSNMHLFLTLVMERYKDINISKARKDAFNFVLRRKSLTMEISHFLQESSILRETENKFVAWNDVTSQISQLKIKNLSVDETYLKTLKRLESQKKHIESQIISKIPENQLRTRLNKATADALSRILKPNSILIEYVKFYPYDFTEKEKEKSWKPPHYLVFLMHAGNSDDIKIIDLGDAANIEYLIKKFRNALSSYRNSFKKNIDINKAEVNFLEISNKLRVLIFDPLKEEIKKGQHLIISPDDELSLLPLEMLPLNSEYLIDHYKISYIGSSRDLLKTNNELSNYSQPVVLTNPDYFLNKSGNSKKEIDTKIKNTHKLPKTIIEQLVSEIVHFKSLKNNQIEGETVAQIMKEHGFEVNLLEKEYATESMIKSLNSPLILHMATHGFFISNDKEKNNQQPNISPLLKSGLALAGANNYLIFNEPQDDSEDGILTAEDVNCLNLSGTEMVVLSACETGLGEVERGEGVFGFRRSFILAGANTLVMSLWKVNDLATMILMRKFYKNLLSEKMERLDALRDAQKYLRNITLRKIKNHSSEYAELISDHLCNESDDLRPFSNPYFWGAFILQGETSTLINVDIKQ